MAAKKKLNEAELIAAARLAYIDPTGQDFWDEVRERMAIREASEGKKGKSPGSDLVERRNTV